MKTKHALRLADLLRSDNIDDKAYWPAIARAMWKAIYTDHETDEDDPPCFRMRYDGNDGSGPILLHLEYGINNHLRWSYTSQAARQYMEETFKFDCALCPKLWRYLVERLPVVAAKAAQSEQP
jgi:hypothetical protein